MGRTVTKFKVGDKVRLSSKAFGPVGSKTGDLCTVVHVDYVTSRVRGPETWSQPEWWVANSNLEPVVVYTPTPAPKSLVTSGKAIVTLRTGSDRVAPSSNPVEHSDFNEAAEEAQRLANKHGKKFDVWVNVARYEPQPDKKPFIKGEFVRAICDTKCHVFDTPVAKGQVVQVISDNNTYVHFNSSPIAGNTCPCLLLNDFERIEVAR